MMTKNRKARSAGGVAEPPCGALTPRGLRWARATAGVLLFLVTGVIIGKFLHGDYKDAEVWYDAGRRVLDGRSLAYLPHYRYPPTFAVLVAPLAALGFEAFFFIWYVVNVVLFAVSLGLAVRLASPAETAALRSRYFWVPALLVSAYAIDNLFLGQTNILIMALLYWAFWDDMKGRPWRAGLPLGAAIAIKAFPAPLLVYYLYRLRLRIVATAVLSCAVFMFVLPAPARGFRRNAEEVGDWVERVAMPYLSRGEAGDWGQHGIDLRNQSLPAVARRFLTKVDSQVMAREREPLHVNIADLSEGTVNAVVLAAFAALGIIFLWACGLRRPRTALGLAAEYGLVTTLLLLVSALSWTYFLVMLALPLAATLRLMDQGGLDRRTRTALRTALWAMGLAAVLMVSDHARAAGNLCWGTVLLFLVLAYASRRLQRVPPTSSPDDAQVTRVPA
ncbi:MAG: DUF2029 domain-containing protein [Armatimonadetes bacterium]|nr:DUF2029 domain-containing protein [Armatimonadota bacterium]